MKKQIDSIIRNTTTLSFFVTLIVIFLALVFFVFAPRSLQIALFQADLGIRNALLTHPDNSIRIHPDILLVDIDDTTLSHEKGLGRWQDFQRKNYATVIEKLTSAGASVIALDVLFSETSDEKNDTTLAQAITNSKKVILGFGMNEKGAIYPLQQFMSGSIGIGFLNPRIQSLNQVAYGIEPLIPFPEKKYEAFSISIARAYLDSLVKRSTNIAGSYDELTSETYPFYPLPGYSSIPLVRPFHVLYHDTMEIVTRPEMFIRWTSQSRQFPRISFVDVFHGNFDPQKVKNKIVIVGTSATALHDEILTPLGILDGMLVHAYAVNTILNKNHLHLLSRGIEMGILGLLMFFLALSLFYLENRIAQIFASFFGVIIFSSIQFLLYRWFDVLMNFPIFYIILIPLLSITVLGIKYILEEKNKRLLKNALSQYLAQDLVLSVLSSYDEVKLGGVRKDITVFFSDIAGFTTFSETMEPETLVSFLSIYLQEVSDIILEEKGFINKYEGDAVMAIWGAFNLMQDQALRACEAALRQQEIISKLNVRFLEKYKFTIQVRMGINAGSAVVGNIGSAGKKIEYTALGDTVNTASRLEGINKYYGTLICCGEGVYKQASSHFEFRKMDEMMVKGKNAPTVLYELLGRKGEVSKDILIKRDIFEEGLSAYFQKNISQAKTCFLRISEDSVAQVFLGRIEKIQSSPEDAEWSPYFRALEK